MKSTKTTHLGRSAIVLFTIAALSLSGCGQPRLSKKVRANLSCTCIRPVVKTGDFFYFGGRAKTATVVGTLAGGLIGGVVAGTMVEKGSNPAKEEILRAMREHNIDVGQIMLSEFKEQVQAIPGFPPIVTDKADGEFCFEVKCGLESPLLSGKLKPMFTFVVQLNGPDGEKLWKNTADVYKAKGKLKGYTHKEYIENPERLREVFSQACEIDRTS
jgi:hypothetical protein